MLLQTLKHYFAFPASSKRKDRYSAAERLFGAILSAYLRRGIASSPLDWIASVRS